MAVVLLPGSVEEEEALTVINAARQDLLVGQHVGKQWDATKTLGSCENLAPQAAGVLSEAIARIDLDPGIRWGAAEAVAGLGQEAGNAAALELAKALLQRKPGQVASDAFVRTGLAESLGRLGRCARGSGAVALARALQDDRDVRVRRRCAMALGQLGGVVAGVKGAAAIARGLKVDKDLPVRCRCAEALGAFGPIAGEDSTKALIQALIEDAEVDVRWRAALSLGQLGATAGKEGAAALLQARAKEKSVPVRDHCAGAAERLVASCLKTMDDNVHPYARGRAAWVLGALGDFAQPEGIEALAAFLLRPGEDVYLRRRAVEALAEQCPKAGPLAALAIKRAMEDPDVYVQWHAFETFNALPKPLQERAEDAGLAEQLHSLILRDVEKQRQLKKSRARQPLIRWEPGTAELEEFAAEKAQQAAEAAEAEAMARAEAEAVRAMQAAEEEAKLMEAMGKAAAALQERARQLLPGVVQRTAAGAGGDDGQGEPEEQLQKTFMDMSRSREVFKHFADGGELNRDALKEALQMLGHDTVNEEWVDAIIKDKFSDRSFLDQYDFSKFLAEYEACHMDYVRMRFTEADVDSSGKVDAQELAQVLRKAGMTPVTGVVPQLIAEVCGPRVTEVNFMNFAKILGILRYRLGFTQEEYSDIATSFKRLDRQGREALNLAEARGCLEWLGFDLSVEEVESYSTRVLKAHRGRTPKEDPEDMLLSEFDFVRLVRLVREEDARRVLTCLLKMRGGQEEDSMPARELPTLLSDMNVALASPDVVFEALKALGLEEKLELTLEDIMPVLWQLRRCQGLTQAELELARQQFEQCDEDGSGGMACAELEFAVRSLGFPVNYEEVQEKLDEWDMDESGEIEFIEFLKVLSDYKKKELQQVLTAMFTGQPKRRPSFAMHAMGEQSQPLPAAPKPKASMLQRQQTELPSLLLQSGHSPLRQGSGVLQFCLDSPAAADKKLNLWGFAGLIAEYRSEINAEIRRNQGFTEAEVIQLYETFRSYDPRGSGIIAKSQLRRLLLEHCPHAERTQAGRDQIATMIRESDQDGSGSIDFMEFLKLMRLVRNRWSREKLAKERAAVADTKFSVRELKEFRKVFKAWDANESLDLNFEELQKMIASITRVAQGAKGEKELHDIFRLFDSNNDNALDFPEFLRVMRKLLAENWRGINDSARRLSRTEIPAFDGALMADIDPGS